MKNITLTVITVLAMTGIIFTGCNTSKEKVEEAKIEVAEAKENLAVAQEEYLEDIRVSRIAAAEKVDANNRNLAEFKEKMAKENKTTQEKYNKRIAELEQKNQEIKKKLDDYQAVGKNEWQIFKTEFNRDLDELGKALNDLTIKNVK